MNRALWSLPAALALAGCTLAQVEVDVVSERTALENQVLGTYDALDREMLLVASVRGVDSAGQIQEPPRRSGEAADAMEAMQVLAFHDDDLARWIDWSMRLLEPLLMAIIGVAVGLVVVLMYMPVFELANSLQ